MDNCFKRFLSLALAVLMVVSYVPAEAFATEIVEVDSTVHEHNYEESITADATCTEAGIVSYTCSCEDSYTEEIPANGHDFVDGACTVCGEADPDYVAPSEETEAPVVEETEAPEVEETEAPEVEETEAPEVEETEATEAPADVELNFNGTEHNEGAVENPVAVIDGVDYTDLQEAINAAADGAKIAIVANIELTAQNAQEYFKPAYNRESYAGLIIPDDKAITLDLNGNTVSYVDAYGDVDNVMILNLGKLTINDSAGGGKLTYKPVAGSSTYSKFYSTIFNCGTLVVNGGTIENTAEAETDVTNAVDNHSRLSHEYGNDSVLIVNGGTLAGAYYYAVRQYTHYLEGVANRVTINGGTIKGGIYMQHGDSWYYADASKNRLNVDCQLTINGGTITVNDTPDAFGKIKSRLNNPDNNAFGLEIKGGDINVPVELLVQRGVYYTNGVSGATTPAESTGTRNAEWLEANGGFISGGTFTELGVAGSTTDISAFVVEGMELKSNGTIGEKFYPIKIGTKGYDTLQAAIDEAEAGDVIKITADLSEADLDVTVNKDVTINLGGNTLNDAYIKVAATVTIQNGSIKNTQESYPLVVNSGKLTVENVAIEASKSDRAIWVRGGELVFNSGSILVTKGENNTTSGNITAIYTSSNTNVTINGGSITVDTPSSKAVAIFGNYANANVTVNDGKISTNGGNYSYGIHVDGDITINGGEIVTNEKQYGYSSGITYGYNYALNSALGDITITGGKITTNGHSGYIANVGRTYSAADQTITITGGEFVNVLTETDKTTGGHKVPALIKEGTAATVSVSVENGKFSGFSGTELVKGSKTTTTVSGGTFDVAVDSKYLADGLVMEDNGDGTFGVVKAPVAKVGEEKFDTLAEAVAAANGGTVEVLCDISESFASLENVTLTTNVEGGVTVTNTYGDDYVDFNKVTVGSGVAMNIPNVYSNGSDSVNVIEGALNVSGTYYHSRGAKTTIQNGGKVTTTGMTVVRYNDDAEAGIYIYGDGNDETVEFSCANTIGAYSGTFYAKDAVIETNQFWLDDKNNGDEGYPVINAVLENSILNVTKDLRLSYDPHLTLKDSAVTAGEFQIRTNATPVVNVDNSTVKANTVLNQAGAKLNAILGTDGTVTFERVILGSGTESDPYQLSSKEDLFAFAEKVNNGTYKNVHAVLTADIDLEQEDWTSIGTSSNPFTGTFDGAGYTISNLWSYDRGLFGYTSTGNYVDSGVNGRATIKNLTVNGAEVYNQSTSAVGGIVGQAGQNTELDNVKLTGYVQIYGYGYVGGIVGQGYVHINDCHVDAAANEDGDMSEINASYWAVGGIIGHAGSEGGSAITNCSVKNVKIFSTYYGAGAIAGVGTSGPIENVSAESVAVEAQSSPDANGLLVGCNYDKITGDKTSVKDVVLTVAGEVVAVPQDMAASIDGQLYVSLQSAVNAAAEGDTITLLADIEQVDGVKITDKKLTIDLNDKTFTVSEGASTNNRNFKIDGASVVTIKNGTMIAAGDYSTGAYGTVRTEGTANVTLEDLKLYNYRGNGLNVKALGGTTVTITDVEVYSEYGGGIEAAGGTIELTDVIVEQKGMYTKPYNSMAISVNGGGTVTVNSGTYTTECITAEEANGQGTSHGPWVAGVLNSGGTLIINGGTFSNDNYGDNALATAARGLLLVDTAGKIEINDGTFNAVKNIFDLQNNLGDADNQPSAQVDGGTFSANPTVAANNSSFIKLPKNYVAKQNADGTWGIKSNSEAWIFREGIPEYFENFTDAVESAVDGEIIIVSANIRVEKELILDKSITISDYNQMTIRFVEGGAIHLTGDNTLTLDKVFVKNAKIYADSVDAGAKVNGEVVTGIVSQPSDLAFDGKNNVLTLVNPQWVAKVGDTYYVNLQDALKAVAAGGTVTLVDDVTITENWDRRYTGATFSVPVTIDGNGHTIKFACDVADGANYHVPFRFEADATIKDLTIDMSAATNSKDSTRIRAVSSKANLTIDGCTFIGNDYTNTRAVIFGEGAGAAINNVTVFVTDSTFTNWRKGLTDNENGQNVKSVTATGNTFTNSGVALSAAESINFSDNTISNAEVTITSYTGTTNDVIVKGNTLDNATGTVSKAASYDKVQSDFTFDVPAIIVRDDKTLFFNSLAEALTAAKDGETVQLIWTEGDAPIAMNGSVFGKTVTITGTATVDWSKGWLFVGRGGEGNGTVIFNNAELTSASNSASYGIHVSGREKNTTNKYDGTVVIKNSKIELDFLINKGTMTLDNSTLTVKNGFAIGGRPASETESGEDATATLTLNNGSKLVVNNHNGMGLGYEAIGIMNVNANSTFECTQDFLVTAKGTMNVNGGTVEVAGKLSNLGTVNITNSTVKLAKLDNDYLMFLNGTNTFQVEDATGSSYAIRANDGVVMNNSYVKGTANETFRLLGDATFNGGFECAYLQGSNAGVGGTVTIEEGTTVKATYGVEFSNDYVLNGGTIELSGGNANGKLWGMVFQSAAYEINTDLTVTGNTGTYAPIYFTDATATINSTITQRNSGGEPLYIGENSVVTLGTDAEIDALSVHGAGKLILNVEGMPAGEYANVKCGASGFTGAIELIGNEDMYAKVVDGKIMLINKIYVAQLNDGKKYESLQDAINDAANGDVINLLVDGISENVTVVQAPDKAIIIDGNDKTFNGTITVDGKSARYDTAGLTIKNVQFDATNISKDACINLGDGKTATRYTSNVKVEDCTFNGNYPVSEKVGIKSYTGGDKNLTVTDCTATGMHSLMQVKNVIDVTVSDCIITESKNGIALGKSHNAAVTGCTVDVEGYGIRADAESEEAATPAGATISGSTIKASQPVVVRKVAIEYDLTLGAGNNFTAAEGNAAITFTAGDDGVEAETPNVAVKLDGEGLNVKDIFPTYQAKIGDTYYPTFAAAISAAEAGNETDLLSDIEASEVILIDKSVTINGNSHKVTSSANRIFRVTASNVEVTLNDVDMVSTAVMVYPSDVRGISIDPSLTNTKLTLNNCSIDFTDKTTNDWTYAVNVSGSGTGHTVTVNGGTYEGANVINVHGANNTVVVKNATLNCLYPNNDMYAGACIWVLQNQSSTVEATGNTFNGDNAVAFNLGTGTELTESNNTDNTKYVVAKVGNTYYHKLADAFADAQDGDTVKLLQNVKIDSETYTIADGVTITFDMNGKKLTVNDNMASNYELFYIYGGMNVTGNGTIELTSTNNREWNAMSAIFHNRGGVLNIENGTFKNLGGTDMAWVIDNSGNWYGKATTNIKDGTLDSTYTAIRNRMEENTHSASGPAILNIYGGKITGTTSAIWAQAASVSTTAPATGKINITGGEIGVINTARSAGAESMTSIKGGTVAAFKGEVNELQVVAPGTITGEVTILDAEGKATAYVIDEEGYYVDAPVQIGTTGYKTLSDAVAAAKDGDTVTLLKDLAVGEITIAKSITLDGNGYKLTPADSSKTYNSAIMAGNSGWGDDHGETITLQNVVFEGWKTNYGVVRAQGVTLNVDGCVFNANSVSNYAYAVLSLNYTDATVVDSEFVNNTSRAIDVNYNGDSSKAVVTIDDCTFNGNTTTGAGIVMRTAGTIAVKNSVFQKNTVNTNGNGATIYVGFGAGNEVYGNIFEGNSVTTSHATTKRFASAIFCDGCIVSNNAFIDNTATRNGETITTTVAVGAYYGEADISGNYWDGNAPAPGVNYTIEYSRNNVVVDNYYADYDAENGLTNKINMTYVAKVGNYSYVTLAAAVAAAKAGETVKLLTDVTIDELIKIEKAITLDLNGKKVTSTAQKAFEVYANATIKNGTIKAAQRCVDTRKAVELTLTDVTLIADEYTSHGNPQPLTIGGSENGTKVTMTNVNISAAAGYGIITFVKTDLTATNSTISGYNALYVKPDSENSVFNFNKCKLSGSTAGNDVEGNSFSVIAIQTDNVTVYADADSTITSIGNYNDAVSIGWDQDPDATGNKVTIMGTISGNVLDVTKINENTVTVSADYGDALNKEGYAYITNGDGSITAAMAVAQVGESIFATLQEAIDAATDGATVTILVDFALTKGVSVPAGKTITLDLNGKTVSYTSNVPGEDMITNRGNLTVTDSTEAKAGKITYNNTDTTASNVTVSTISTEAGSTLVINAGTVENKTVQTGAIYSYAIDILTNGNLGDVTVTVNGGTVTSDYMAIRQFNNGEVCKNTLNVNGGYIYGAKRAIQVHMNNNAAYTNITAGTVEGGNYSLCMLTSSGNLSVIGGTFLGNVYSGTTGFISGGFFTDANVEYYLAEGYGLSYKGGLFMVEIVPVASVGGVDYNTLQAAINAAEEGETVYLKKDIVLKDTVTVPADKTIILNLKGYTISQEKECTASYSMIENKGNLTITGNGKISFTDTGAGDATFGWGSYTIHNSGTLVVDNGIIEFNGDQAFGTHCSLAIFQYSGSTTINGGEIINDAYRSVRLWHGDMTINGGTFQGQVWVHCVDDSAKLTINGGSFAPSTKGDASSVFVNNSGKKAELSVTGGTFAGKISANDVAALAGSITNGLFTETAKNGTSTDLLAKDYAFSDAATDGYFTIVPAIYVAMIGEVGYVSLAEAFAAAEDGDTITLIADTAMSESVNNTKKVTLDLNGKTITGTDNTEKNFGLINNTGDLTITGNGTITLTATVNSGWNRYSAVISNNPGGKLTVENGTIEHLGGTDMAYGIDSLTNGGIGDVSVTINGGTVKSTYRGIRQFLNSDSKQNVLTVNGGVIEGGNKAIFFHDPSTKANNGTITVTDGATITNGVYLYVTAGSTQWPVDVSISCRAVGENGITTANVPAGYKVEKANGKWTVEKIDAVAQIGERFYDDLTDALEDAASDETVILLKDTEESYVVIPTDVTLDLQDHALTANNLIGFNGSFLTATTAKDGSGGKLIVPKGNIILSEQGYTNETGYYILPIWDDASNCYLFSLFNVNTETTNRGLYINRDNKEEIYFQFKHEASGEINRNLLIDGADNNELKIVIMLEWTDEKGAASQEFVYNDGFVGKVADTENKYDYTFTLTNYSALNINIETLSVQARIVTNSGAIAFGQVWDQYNAK